MALHGRLLTSRASPAGVYASSPRRPPTGRPLTCTIALTIAPTALHSCVCTRLAGETSSGVRVDCSHNGEASVFRFLSTARAVAHSRTTIGRRNRNRYLPLGEWPQGTLHTLVTHCLYRRTPHALVCVLSAFLLWESAATRVTAQKRPQIGQ